MALIMEYLTLYVEIPHGTVKIAFVYNLSYSILPPLEKD